MVRRATVGPTDKQPVSVPLDEGVEHTFATGFLKLHRELIALDFDNHSIAEFHMEDPLSDHIVGGRGYVSRYQLAVNNRAETVRSAPVCPGIVFGVAAVGAGFEDQGARRANRC